MPDYAILPLGDQAVTFSIGNTIDLGNHRKLIAMRDWLQQHRFPGLLDIVVAYNSVTVVYDFYSVQRNGQSESAFSYVSSLMLDAYRQSGRQSATASIIKRIPVCYETPFAPDIELVMAEKGLSRDQVVALHTGRDYQVYMIGFLPGFPYMAEVDPLLTLSRKATPRARVEAGSVGIAGVQTGIYPVASPGGWQIIGRTPICLFHRDSNPPVVLEPGDQVHFYQITASEFWKMNDHHS